MKSIVHLFSSFHIQSLFHTLKVICVLCVCDIETTGIFLRLSYIRCLQLKGMARVPEQPIRRRSEGRRTNCVTFLKLWGKRREGEGAKRTSEGMAGEKGRREKKIPRKTRKRDFFARRNLFVPADFFPPCHFSLHPRIAGNFTLVLFADDAVAVLYLTSLQVYLYGLSMVPHTRYYIKDLRQKGI